MITIDMIDEKTEYIGNEKRSPMAHLPSLKSGWISNLIGLNSARPLITAGNGDSKDAMPANANPSLEDKNLVGKINDGKRNQHAGSGK